MSTTSTLPITGAIVIAGHSVGTSPLALIGIGLVLAGAILVRLKFRRGLQVDDL